MNTTNGMKFDLVCGMEVDSAEAKHTSEYKGETYYFCSASCKEHFVNDPEKYARAIEEALSKDWGNLPRKQAEKFSWDIIADEYEKLFEELA